MTVGEIVEAAIGAVGGNQAELARRLGVGNATVSRWFSDKGIPDYASCLRLSKITEIAAADVLRAAGHDPSLLPDNLDSMTPEEAELRARRRAREIERELAPLPEEHQEVAWEAALGVLRSFRVVAAPRIAVATVAA